MKVLISGRYDSSYNRNLILINGLLQLGVEIVEFPFTKKTKKNFRQIQQLAHDVDLVYVPSFAHVSVGFIKKAIKSYGIPLVFDPLISNYLTKVFDYKIISMFSPRRVKNFYKDKFALQKADFLIADTLAHRDYYCEKFGISTNKFEVVRVGVDRNEFKPLAVEKKDFFKIGFYGNFNPLQGIPLIMEAAKIMKQHDDCKFEIIGKGFDWEKVQKYAEEQQLDNVTFAGRVPYNELNDRINDFDVCLGIFGDSLKADIVIPNKVYHYTACRKPIITKNTQGIKELFTDDKDILLVENKAQAIVDKILYLKENPEKATAIAENGYQLITQNYNEIKVAETLFNIFKKVIL